jgi:hypothetical protein
MQRPPALPPPEPPPVNGNEPQHDRQRLLPPHKGKVSRIQDYVQGTVGGLREWMELRIELAKAEIREKIAEVQEQAKFGALIGVFAALAGFFLLLTIGFGFSALFRALFNFGQLASLTAGYGLLTLLLAIAAGVFYSMSPFRDGDK